jgi:transposase
MILPEADLAAAIPRRQFASLDAALKYFHHDGMDSSRFRCDMIAASADTHQRNQEETAMDATTVAVDLVKTVFELAIANDHWRIISRQRLNRAQFARFLAQTPPTHVVMEACGTAHYWGRVAQRHGHRVTLLPPAYVRPYVRRNKTDRADVEALLEAVRSGGIPSVPVKRVEQQAMVAVHRVREQWMTTRTARINVLRGILREQGVLLPAGARAAVQAVPRILDETARTLPRHLRQVLESVHDEVRTMEARITALERELRVLADADPVVTRLRTIPGIGLLTATALVGTVGHIHAFRRARQFASWLGLTPREHSSGHRRRLGGISKRGDVYLRCLLTHGARAVLIAAQRRRREGQPSTRLHQWAVTVRDRRGHNKATIAVTNKLARIVWAVWHKDVPFALPVAA